MSTAVNWYQYLFGNWGKDKKGIGLLKGIKAAGKTVINVCKSTCNKCKSFFRKFF